MSQPPELTALIADGLSALSLRLSRRTMNGALAIASVVHPSLPSVLRGVLGLADFAVNAVVSASRYRQPLPHGMGEACASLCESAAQAMRHIGAALPPEHYHDRLQMSHAATALHNVYVQLRGPLRYLVTYADLDDVYGATLSSNASGGRRLSPLRDQNAFQALMEAGGRAPLFIGTQAAGAMDALIASDPVLRPLSATSISGYLSDIATGTRIT